MPPEEKFSVVRAITKETQAERPERRKYAESKIRKVCTARWLDWDARAEEERLDFINESVHENRECNR